MENILQGKLNNASTGHSGKTAERMKGLIDVRDSVSELIELQLDDASDEEIRASQARLNSVYDSFVKSSGT